MEMPQIPDEHPVSAEEFDNRTAQAFAEMLKMTMARARRQGRQGWHQKELVTAEVLSMELRLATLRGDPIEVAMSAMFLWARGEVVTRLLPMIGSSTDVHALMRHIDAGREVQLERNLSQLVERRQGCQPGAPQRRATDS